MISCHKFQEHQYYPFNGVTHKRSPANFVGTYNFLLSSLYRTKTYCIMSMSNRIFSSDVCYTFLAFTCNVWIIKDLVTSRHSEIRVIPNKSTITRASSNVSSLLEQNFKCIS